MVPSSACPASSLSPSTPLFFFLSFPLNFYRCLLFLFSLPLLFFHPNPFVRQLHCATPLGCLQPFIHSFTQSLIHSFCTLSLLHQIYLCLLRNHHIEQNFISVFIIFARPLAQVQGLWLLRKSSHLIKALTLFDPVHPENL